MKLPFKNRFCKAKRWRIAFLLTALLCNYLPAKNKTDSLKHVVASLPDNEKKADALNELAWSVLFNNSDEGEKYIRQALELSKSLHYKKGLARSYNELGALASIKSDSKEALKYGDQ